VDFDAHFKGFLVSTVNLKPWKLDLLDTRVTAITDAFQADTVVGPRYKEHIRQGSWAHLTIMPLLDDPSCPGTSFNHRWDDDEYATFKKKAADYAAWAREAYDLQDADADAALTAWQKMFGPEFAADEVKDARTQVLVNKAVRAVAALGDGANITQTKDVAPQEEFIQNKYGSVQLRYDARIEAALLGNYPKNLRRLRVAPKHRNLRFQLVTDTPEPYDVLWKVRNHGPEASRVAGGLRGKIRHGGSEGRNLHTESTAYRGTHYVEAYVVKNGVVVASDHHDVKII
jgi:hypothetical protein